MTNNIISKLTLAAIILPSNQIQLFHLLLPFVQDMYIAIGFKGLLLLKYPNTFEMESCSAIFSAMGLAGSIFQFFRIDRDLRTRLRACMCVRACHVHMPCMPPCCALARALRSGLVWSVFYTRFRSGLVCILYESHYPTRRPSTFDPTS